MFSWGSGPKTYRRDEVIALARNRLGELSGEKARLDRETRESINQGIAIAEEIEGAGRDLSATLLPAFHPSSLAAAAFAIGLPPLASEPIQEYNEDLRRSQERLAYLNNDAEFLQRNDLLHPDYGSLLAARGELNGHLAALQPTLQPCENHPRWQKLTEDGYGTPHYTVGWWRLSYYANWKAGDEIEDLHGGKPFLEILDTYNSARASADVLEARRASVQSDIDRVQGKVDEHARLTQHLTTLVSEHLERTRQRLLQHLAQVQLADLPESTRNHPAFRTLLARWHALRAKRGYLEELRRVQLQTLSEALAKEQGQLNRQIIKLSRPKHSGFRLSQADAEKRYLSRSAKVNARLQRHHKIRTRVVEYHHYDRVDLTGPVLWWDVFHDGRDEGAYLPGVVQFRNRNADYRYQRWSNNDEAIAAAADLDSRNLDPLEDLDPS